MEKSNFFNPIKILFVPVNFLLEHIPVRSVWWAKLICKLVPNQCPFERDVSVLGKELHIPPLCKLNPTYDGLVALKFHSLETLGEHHIDTTSFV